ncbi:MAG: amidohydrolase family protein [Alphaproteobacteria bacterium]|nr:amidohydrolase family protein [Alphaproteobacteria bacterium]
MIEGQEIRAIGPAGLAAPADARAIDASDRLLMPGLVNGHSHSHGGLGRGLVGDRWSLENFLNASGAINGNRDRDDKRLSALLTATELIAKGCTAVYDLAAEAPAATVEGIHAIASAYQEIGLRAVVAPMLADRSFYAALPGLIDAMPAELQRRAQAIAMAPCEATLATCRTAFAQWPTSRDLVRPAIAPTIPLHCSDEFLTSSARLARDFDIGLQTHLGETKVQAALGRRKYGRSLTRHLAGLGLVDRRFSAAHAIWIDDDDIASLADAGAAVVHNPMSNLRIGSGLAPVRRMIDRGLTVALGTDGSHTSDGQNMFEAARLGAYLSRIQTHDRARWLAAPETLRMATLGSARVLGLDDRIGRLAPGYLADIVFIDLSGVSYQPLRAPLLQLAFTETGANVDSVMIDGRFVLRHRKFVTIDYDRLRADAAAAAARLNPSVRAGIAAAQAMESTIGLFCAGPFAQPLGFERIAEACRF